MTRGRVLLVDDERELRDALAIGLRHEGFEVEEHSGAAEAEAAFEAGDFDVVLTDVRLSGGNGLDLCHGVTSIRPDVAVVLMTAYGSVENAIAGIRAGAYDFVTKPIEIVDLCLTLDRAVQRRRLSAEVRRLRHAVDVATGFDEILGESPAIRRLRQVVAQVAETDATVLITGESGTGKELVARAIHRASARAQSPFVPVNCAALPEALVESELFGHRKGAFTDAATERIGLFQSAHRGTLFLDEIGELPLSVQPKLLRALQERKTRPVGGSDEVNVDLRIIAATNRDLESAVEAGRFRADLWYRVNVVAIAVPPLRERGGDLLVLAQHFVREISTRLDKPVDGLSRAAAEHLLAYRWPGNVRELQNCIERAVALTRYREIMPEDLPETVRQKRRGLISEAHLDEFVPLDELERDYILRVLEAVGGNKREAARILGLDRSTLYRKFERYRIDVA